MSRIGQHFDDVVTRIDEKIGNELWMSDMFLRLFCHGCGARGRNSDGVYDCPAGFEPYGDGRCARSGLVECIDSDIANCAEEIAADMARWGCL